MHVFVTGATGFVGSAIVQELLRQGHQVVGLVRSAANAQKLRAAGAEPILASLTDLERLKRAASAADGVIHTAHNHDFVNVSREVAAAEDLQAIEALGGALLDSGRPFLTTSGLSGRTEVDTGDVNSMPRLRSDAATLALAARGVRAAVVRLPPTVHGRGDHGFLPMLIGIARATGVSAYIEEGRNCWSAVHRSDAARLYCLALEKGRAGVRYHAVAETGVSTKDIAEAIGRGLGLPVVSKSNAEAAEHFGFLAHFFGRDVTATSAQTREQLGFSPSQPGLIHDLEHGGYFDTGTDAR